MHDEDLNRLLVGNITNGSTFETGKVNFESLIKWFHDNPDEKESGTWRWSAHVCHSWSPESNTAFVMLIHDMINKTVDVQEPYRGYMKDNMKNATRYFVDTQNQDGSWSSGDDQAMATALALWGLEAFALPSDNVSVDQITTAKEKAKTWLIDAQDSDGSWPAGSYYGWYDNGRITESTGYAVLALNATGLTAENETIQKGVNWLIEQYESGGGWGYTWASQVAIDALIHCQPTEVVTGEVKIAIDEKPIGTFMVDSTNPRIQYTLTSGQMGTLMAGGTEVRPIEASGGKGEVRSHRLTAAITSGNGPILVSVDHSQSAPVNEIDGKIQGSRLIQSFGYEEEAGLLQVSTDIGILTDIEEEKPYTVNYAVNITSSTPMVAGDEADLTITVTSDTNVYSPMIEIPIAGFTFDNESVITENDHVGTFEVLSSSTGGGQLALFIESVGWVAGEHQTYQFTITPQNHGALDMDLRIRPLYDETQVTFANATFTVMGRGNVTVNVVDETGMPVDAESITLVGANTVADKSSYTFTGILEGTYPLVVNKTGFPSIRTTVGVTPDATALYNVTLPSSLADPTLVFSEGGAGSIAGVEHKPAGRLSAAYAENTTYNVTVLGNGGEIGIALEFPMRYLMNSPVVKVNGVATEYEFINGTFEYDTVTKGYSTTNATLVIYNTTAGSNTVEIGFEGGLLGDAYPDGTIDPTDALMILHFYVGNIDGFENFDYPFVFNREEQRIDPVDALMVLHRYVGKVNEYYQSW
jgi:hypothetical protein